MTISGVQKMMVP